MAKKQDKPTENSTDQEFPKPKEYTPDELTKVFDQLIFEGEYREDVAIRGKLRVTFRTRTADETMEISRQLDGLDYKLLPTIQEQRAFLNICKSLVAYQGKDLTQITPNAKVDFIRSIPTPILSSVADALGEFDRKVDLACRDAENSF